MCVTNISIETTLEKKNYNKFHRDNFPGREIFRCNLPGGKLYGGKIYSV